MPFKSHAYRGKWEYCVDEIMRKPKHMDDLQTLLFNEDDEEYDTEDEREQYGHAVVESDVEDSE